MISFRVLGPVSLTGHEGQELRSITAQPRRLALLAVLALRDAAAPVGELPALLWPELDAESARESLRHAVRELRNALGEGAVVERGDGGVALAPGAVWCDAVEMEKALAGGRL